MGEHCAPPGDIVDRNSYGVLNKAGHARRSTSRDEVADLLDLFVIQGDGDLLRRHTGYHIGQRVHRTRAFDRVWSCGANTSKGRRRRAVAHTASAEVQWNPDANFADYEGTAWSGRLSLVAAAGNLRIARHPGRSVELKRRTEGVVDGLKFLEIHAANKFAESFRRSRRRLIHEHPCCFAVQRDGRMERVRSWGVRLPADVVGFAKLSSADDVAGETEPQVGAQPKGLDINAFVIAVEPIGDGCSVDARAE